MMALCAIYRFHIWHNSRAMLRFISTFVAMIAHRIIAPGNTSGTATSKSIEMNARFTKFFKFQKCCNKNAEMYYKEFSMENREEILTSAKMLMERLEDETKLQLTLLSEQEEKLMLDLADEVKEFRLSLNQNRATFSNKVSVDILDLILVENAASELITARTLIQQINTVCQSRIGNNILASCL